MLAGVDHLTILPYLLAQLTQSVSTDVKYLFDSAPLKPDPLPGIMVGNRSYLLGMDVGQRKLTLVC
jgi:hypothetical protein